MLISQVFKRRFYQAIYLKEGGGTHSLLHAPFERKGGAPDPLHPTPLGTGLNDTYSFILLLSPYSGFYTIILYSDI